MFDKGVRHIFWVTASYNITLVVKPVYTDHLAYMREGENMSHVLNKVVLIEVM